LLHTEDRRDCIRPDFEQINHPVCSEENLKQGQDLLSQERAIIDEQVIDG
jgi:hypothetical protein